MMDKVVIGTRGSELALWQANRVADSLRAAFPGTAVEVRTISTTGDRVLEKPLEDIGDKGLFTKELETALLRHEVDLCVHSMKDMPTELPDGCVIGGMLVRGDARDVLVCGPRIEQANSLEDVPAGARLGTGSLRRTAQLRAFHPHVVPCPIRGNVDTRLAKAAGPDYDGAVLAAAGVQRMGAQDRIAAYLSIEEMVPAPGQGAIGIEIRDDHDERIARMCEAIGDSRTERCVTAERAVLAALEGGCQAPIGAFARYEDDRLRFNAIVCSLDGLRIARVALDFACDIFPLEAAAQVVAALEADGARSILSEVAERRQRA